MTWEGVIKMAHIEKYVAAQVGGIIRHDLRANKEIPENVNSKLIKNNDIMINEKLQETYGKEIRSFKDLENACYAKIKSIKSIKRKDINKLVSVVITIPPGLKREDEDKFFNYTSEFLMNRYGADNFLYATIHRDEPKAKHHMHYKFVPAREKINKRTGEKEWRFDCKHIINLKEMRTFHSDFNKYIDKKLGYHVEILRNVENENGQKMGITKAQGGNKTISELKYETAAKEYNEKQKQLEQREKIVRQKELEQNEITKQQAAEKQKIADGWARIADYWDDDYKKLQNNIDEFEQNKKSWEHQKNIEEIKMAIKKQEVNEKADAWADEHPDTVPAWIYNKLKSVTQEIANSIGTERLRQLIKPELYSKLQTELKATLRSTKRKERGFIHSKSL